MSEALLRWLVRAALCSSAWAAQAQGAGSSKAPAARPDPLDAKASVPALTFSSPLSRFRGLDDDKPVDWRKANDAVARIGGWRVYAREAQQPEPGPQPMPPDHAGHETR